MKRSSVLRNLLFITALIILFSCEKEAQFCWECQTTNKTVNGGTTVTTVSGLSTTCNMSTREMELFCQSKISGNTTTYKTCTKQQ